MRGPKPGPRVENFDLPRRQPAENLPRRPAQQAAIAPVHPLEMPEQQREPLQMRRAQLAIHTVEWVSHRMRDALLEKVFLQVVNTLPHPLDLAVLRLVDPPHQNVHAAFILGKNRRDLLAHDHIRQVRDFEAAIDGVLVRERDEPHPRRPQHGVKLPRLRRARREIQPPQNPIRRPHAEPRVDVEVGAGGGVHGSLRREISHC